MHFNGPYFSARRMSILAVFLLGLPGMSAYRAKADFVSGRVFSFRQPDGSTVDVRVWGDEFYHVAESLDGYTLVRDRESGAVCYARLSSDGNELVSTGVPVGSTLRAGLNLEPHLRINRASARAKVAQARARLAQNKADVLAALGRDVQLAPLNRGNVEGIVLLVDFDDCVGTIDPAEIYNYCNQVGYSGYGNNGSVRDYFHDVSDGNLTYTNFVPDTYYRAQNLKTWYGDESIPCCTRAQQLVLEALNDLDNQGFDFSQYDSDYDGVIDAVSLFYAGSRDTPGYYGLWPHAAWISFSADGVSTGRYQITDIGYQPTLRTFLHENGHMLFGWHDLYDYGYESTGVGNFCLMCYGGSDTNPVEPCAYLKYTSGWTSTTVLAGPQSGLTASAGINTVYKYEHALAANEYYLIENRQQTGRDTAIPDHGLAIWHVDTHGSNDYQQMTPQYHYECTLVQADGDWDLENGRNHGDSTDLWAAPSYTECTPETIPNTDWWDGSTSHLFVTDISTSGSVMTFTYLSTRDCNKNGVPDYEDILEGTSTDVNTNGIPDECECEVSCNPPQEEPVVVAKNRLLSFVPGNPGQQTALRVKFLDLPAPFDGLNGETMWVGQPKETCENAGQVTPPPEGCGIAPGLPSLTFTAVRLQCDPYYTDWSTVGMIHVYHELIVPSGTYQVQAIDQACQTVSDWVYSNPLLMATSRWGDVVSNCVTKPCGPPDGVVGIVTDVTAVLDKFKNLDGAVTKARADLEPSFPDLLVNIADVTETLDAFRGFDYPFPAPTSPPCP